MSAFFRWAMRFAAPILFGLAVVIAAGIVAYHVFIYLETARSLGSGSMTMSPPLSILQLAFSVLSGLGGAALPLFGAAIIWRIDQWLARADREDGE